MNMTLRVINKDDHIMWELSGGAIVVKRLHYYKLVENAIEAAKQVAKKFSINIMRCYYVEPDNDYSCKLNI